MIQVLSEPIAGIMNIYDFHVSYRISIISHYSLLISINFMVKIFMQGEFLPFPETKVVILMQESISDACCEKITLFGVEK